ncbi:hypothetical protein [Streptomyces sp. NBC_00448]|uniref:hypothetical protein n=1 Tax=Streptomyces sp. NBC_00448 TaxID=2903652 RepID=UPI002E2011C6
MRDERAPRAGRLRDWSISAGCLLAMLMLVGAILAGLGTIAYYALPSCHTDCRTSTGGGGGGGGGG